MSTSALIPLALEINRWLLDDANRARFREQVTEYLRLRAGTTTRSTLRDGGQIRVDERGLQLPFDDEYHTVYEPVPHVMCRRYAVLAIVVAICLPEEPWLIPPDTPEDPDNFESVREGFKQHRAWYACIKDAQGTLKDSHAPMVQACMDAVKRDLQAAAPCEDQVRVQPPAEPATNTPEKLLLSWREITTALGRPWNKASQQQIRRLNDLTDGPITKAKKGSQPRVRQRDLLEWWRKQTDRHTDADRRLVSSPVSAKEQVFPYGRAAEVVVPGIGGHIKKHRRDAKSKR